MHNVPKWSDHFGALCIKGLSGIGRSHKNAKYTSATSQNEITDVINSDINLRDIV